MILCSATPARAAVVAKPDRSECPLNSSGAKPAASARRLTIRVMPPPEGRSAVTRPLRRLRNAGPSSVPAVSTQARHDLTHLAEAGVSLPLLMAKSGHQNLRSLQKYARPGPETVAATVSYTHLRAH